jgi:23S rRNA (adenine2503-C2)-methyltransferase
MTQEILGLTLEELQTKFVEMGLKKYRARQVFEWLYAKAAVSFDEMTNLSKDDRSKLEENFTILTAQLQVLRELNSEDGLTEKVLLRFPDGAAVETVLMHHDYGYSICLSSQVGCNMGCAFCASGLLGMERNLTAGEILAQLYYFQKKLNEKQHASAGWWSWAVESLCSTWMQC